MAVYRRTAEVGDLLGQSGIKGGRDDCFTEANIWRNRHCTD
jgi:hypothetical protein